MPLQLMAPTVCRLLLLKCFNWMLLERTSAISSAASALFIIKAEVYLSKAFAILILPVVCKSLIPMSKTFSLGKQLQCNLQLHNQFYFEKKIKYLQNWNWLYNLSLSYRPSKLWNWMCGSLVLSHIPFIVDSIAQSAHFHLL